MNTLGTVVAAFAFLVVGMMAAMQVILRRRVRAMNGARVPSLPGPIGERVALSVMATPSTVEIRDAPCPPLRRAQAL